MRQNKKATHCVANDNGGENTVVVDLRKHTEAKQRVSKMRRVYLFMVDAVIISGFVLAGCVAFVTYLGIAGKRLETTLAFNSPVVGFTQEQDATQPVALYPGDDLANEIDESALPGGGQ